MPVPNLLHPVDVVLELISRSTTVYDVDAREPIQTASRVAPITCPAQMAWTGRQLEANDGGPSESVDGYALFRTTDLAARSITLQHNDRIITVAGIVYDLYIVRLIPMGHYPGLGATLLKAWFRDRLPAKEPA